MCKQRIICPECNSIQVGTIENTLPFPTYLHECSNCNHIIMESEWQEVKTLHLNLFYRWFDMIYEGIKPDEYREITPYWCNRLLLYEGKHQTKKWWSEYLSSSLEPANRIKTGLKVGTLSFKSFDTITFSNGYAKSRAQFEIVLNQFQIDYGNPKWGAESGKEYFVLSLGKLCPESDTR